MNGQTGRQINRYVAKQTFQNVHCRWMFTVKFFHFSRYMFENFNKMLEKYMIVTFRVHTTVYITADRTSIKISEWKLILFYNLVIY